ncbi:MAG: hypothetical protein E6L03_10490 [Thaumarchaeota archaeon]|nr:MAG: hypothetical protein E6L03_10490 [Nitrososphaerota archaeon]
MKRNVPRCPKCDRPRTASRYHINPNEPPALISICQCGYSWQNVSKMTNKTKVEKRIDLVMLRLRTLRNHQRAIDSAISEYERELAKLQNELISSK